MKKISIKCVDGSRCDYIFTSEEETPLEEILAKPFFSITAKDGRVVFNVSNVVCITETEIDDAENN